MMTFPIGNHHIHCLLRGLNPSETYESQLGSLFPMYGKINKMFQTTNQLWYTLCCVVITHLSDVWDAHPGNQRLANKSRGLAATRSDTNRGRFDPAPCRAMEPRQKWIEDETKAIGNHPKNGEWWMLYCFSKWIIVDYESFFSKKWRVHYNIL